MKKVPHGWTIRPLGDLVAAISAGVSVNSEDRPIQPGEIGVLKTSCVTRNVFDPAEHKAVVASDVLRVRIPVRAGSVIMSRMNTPALVGANAYVHADHPRLFLPDRLWQIRPAQGTDGRWLAFVTGSPRFRSMIQAAATGTSNSMKNVSQEAVLSTPVLAPPFEEQRRIAEMLSAWDDSLSRLERYAEQLTRQRDALAVKLFAGQLSVLPKIIERESRL